MSKLKEKTCTYSKLDNYWAPLADDNEEDEDDDIINNLNDVQIQEDFRSTIRNWITQRLTKNKLLQPKTSTMIVDSGATSHFIRAEEKLPNTGISTKVVFLPNGEQIKASHTTELPFPSLSTKARHAVVLPGLRQHSLLSVGKFSDAGYTTVFHPHGKGLTVHKPHSFKLKTRSEPVLQGWRDSMGLWRVSPEHPLERENGQPRYIEAAANVYNLPSIAQVIKYHHAAAGFPTKDTWVKAIKAGFYVSWPGLIAEAASKHFPESEETQKGHLKKQRQNVRSTKRKVTGLVMTMR